MTVLGGSKARPDIFVAMADRYHEFSLSQAQLFSTFASIHSGHQCWPYAPKRSPAA
jgi:hypothetical protein